MPVFINHLANIETWWYLPPIFMLLAVYFFGLRKNRFLISSFLLQLGTFLLVELIRFFQWKNDALLSYYLPPRGHLFFQQLGRFAVTLVAAMVAAGVVYVVCRYLFIRRGQGKMLDEKDVQMLTLATLAVGWPGVLVFLGILFDVTVLGMLVLVVLRKRSLNDRLVVTPFIVPAALVTFLFKMTLLFFTNLYKIKF